MQILLQQILSSAFGVLIVVTHGRPRLHVTDDHGRCQQQILILLVSSYCTLRLMLIGEAKFPAKNLMAKIIAPLHLYVPARTLYTYLLGLTLIDDKSVCTTLTFPNS